jgi:hypothetical protein
VRFQDAAPDARSIVYAGIQTDPMVARAAAALEDASLAERVMARAVMNGESTEPSTWMAMFPTLFGTGVAEPDRRRAQAVLAASLAVAERGEQVRSQFRGAIVEALTERLLGRRGRLAHVRRERRILFDGVRAEIHPYDVTLESDDAAEAWDCKWGARGINEDVLHQLDDARTHAADEDVRLRTGLVIFDAERSCEVRLRRLHAPRDATLIVTLESLASISERDSPT